MANGGVIRRAYAETPHGQIHYRHAGDGPVLLMLHQTAGSSETYDPLILYLAPSCSAIAVDSPGFGMSDRPHHTEYAVADYAKTSADFMSSLGIERASVFAHHTGASFACELAAGYPERVDKLILYGVPYWKDPATDEAIASFRARETPFTGIDHSSTLAFVNTIERFALKQDGTHLLEAWSFISGRTEPSFPRPFDKAIAEAVHREAIWKLVAGERYAEAYLAIARYEMADRLPLIEAPTLVMTGEDDPLWYTMEPVAAKLKRVRTHVRPGGSYLMTHEDTEDLARVILDFLADPGV